MADGTPSSSYSQTPASSREQPVSSDDQPDAENFSEGVSPLIESCSGYCDANEDYDHCSNATDCDEDGSLYADSEDDDKDEERCFTDGNDDESSTPRRKQTAVPPFEKPQFFADCLADFGSKTLPGSTTTVDYVIHRGTRIVLVGGE